MPASKTKVKLPHPVPVKGLLDENEEERLAKKLFGESHEKIAESSSDDDRSDTEQETQASSVWRDEDDIGDEVEIPSGKTAVLLKRNTDSGGCVVADEYRSRLRRAFERQHHGTPKWAKLEPSKDVRQKEGDDSDAEVEAEFDEMTRSSHRYLDKDPLVVKDIVSTFRWPDITIGHHDTQPINSILFHNVRPVVITGGASGKVQLFRVGDRSEAGNFLQNVQFSKFPITSMSLLHGGCSAVCGSVRQDYLMMYDLEKAAVMQMQLPKCVPRQNVGNFAVSTDGTLLAMVGRNCQVYVLSASSMELVRTLSAPTDVTSLQFLPGSSHELWAMTERGEVVIWKIAGSHHVFRDEGAVRGTKIRLSADGDRVACGSNTGIVNLYDVADVRNAVDPKPRAVASNLLTSCDSIAFNHDCQIMAFSSNVKKNQVKLLHVASSTVFQNFPKKHEKMSIVQCVEFSPHSGYFGIGCANGQLILERMNHFDDY